MALSSSPLCATSPSPDRRPQHVSWPATGAPPARRQNECHPPPCHQARHSKGGKGLQTEGCVRARIKVAEMSPWKLCSRAKSRLAGAAPTTDLCTASARVAPQLRFRSPAGWGDERHPRIPRSSTPPEATARPKLHSHGRTLLHHPMAAEVRGRVSRDRGPHEAPAPRRLDSKFAAQERNRGPTKHPGRKSSATCNGAFTSRSRTKRLT